MSVPTTGITRDGPAGAKAPDFYRGLTARLKPCPHDYAKHAAYIRQNPVEARLVNRAEDYPYSSANVQIELAPCPQGLKPRIFKTG